MSRRACAGVLLCATTLSLAAAPAAATTARQVRLLATRAAGGEPQALRELETVSQVDGQFVQIGAALAGATPAQLRSRLAALSSPSAPRPVSSATARDRAVAILAAARFRGRPLTDPLASLFAKLGRLLNRAASGFVGGPPAFWAVLAGVVLALTAFGARRMIGRLDPLRRERAAQVPGVGEDPYSLELAADEAESRSAFAEAVRLRFRAGLLTLNSRGLIDYRPSLLTADVARQLDSRQFDNIAARFERVAYGGADADRGDAAAAREGWRELLAGARGR
jgi:hypothetical protein